MPRHHLTMHPVSIFCGPLPRTAHANLQPVRQAAHARALSWNARSWDAEDKGTFGYIATVASPQVQMQHSSCNRTCPALSAPHAHTR